MNLCFSPRDRDFFKSVRRIVVKVGSAVLTDDAGLNEQVLQDICTQVASLTGQGKKFALVSSGAVAAGLKKLPHLALTGTVPEKQALAALGQSLLMQAYEQAFSNHSLHVAQILLTREGLVPRHRYLNAKNTLQTLIHWKIIPVINENDTVAIEELQFTDNDALAVLIVNLVEADLLICLSDVDGLYNSDPRQNPDARRIRSVQKVDETITAMAGESPGRAGRGGMKSKLESARMVTACGIPMVVAGGKTPGVLQKLFSGEDIGTAFLPRKRRRIYGRKPWIAFTLAREGSIILDNGAVKAVTEDGGSLLPVGICGIEGDFEAGACVICRDSAGKDIAVGLTSFSSDDLRKICGCQTEQIHKMIKGNGKKEVIHRDNMVIL